MPTLKLILKNPTGSIWAIFKPIHLMMKVSTFTRVPGIHDDQHSLLFEPSDSSVVYFTGDGGIYRCSGDPLSCQNRNNELRSIMFYDLAVARDFPSLVLGGTQDNGTIVSDGSPFWTELWGGDGRYVAFDPNNYQRIYAQHQYLADTSKAEDWNNGTSVQADWQTSSGLPFLPSARRGLAGSEIWRRSLLHRPPLEFRCDS